MSPAVLRGLTADDIPAAMALVRHVAWNQTPADWGRFLRAQPDGCFAADLDGRVVGSVTTIVYEAAFARAPAATHAPVPQRRVAWIGMLIVDAAHRGKGLGAQLLHLALEYLDRLGVSCVKLDATPQGQDLYEKHGFSAELSIERCELARDVSRRPRESPPLASSSIDAIVAADRRAFGADRSGLLRSVIEDAPDLAVALEADGEVIGYGCGRRGARADHLGPWMGCDAQAASQVLRTFLDRSNRPLVYVDLLTDNPWSSRLAAANGFRLSRPLTRMYRGVPTDPGDLQSLGAIVGPEFG